jgi:hypothetical protein
MKKITFLEIVNYKYTTKEVFQLMRNIKLHDEFWR